MWHVLTVDRTTTLCGVEKEDEPRRRDTTDRHCFPCMESFQEVVEAR
ncbi:hypothetical protein [Streptomyces sp. KMM 9044]|nr:hypothetical protein [Streptomyces sp. KMM 9044]WAX76457.1 hypothetical protein HUV60_000895 [Streptomyces sp. KMM 9044]